MAKKVEKKEVKKTLLSDKAFTIIKWILAAFIPPLITLIETLSTIYKFDSSVIILTIGAISTFLASLLGISNYSYRKNN